MNSSVFVDVVRREAFAVVLGAIVPLAAAPAAHAPALVTLTPTQNSPFVAALRKMTHDFSAACRRFGRNFPASRRPTATKPHGQPRTTWTAVGACIAVTLLASAGPTRTTAQSSASAPASGFRAEFLKELGYFEQRFVMLAEAIGGGEAPWTP